MRRILSLLLAFTIMLFLCGCQGNFGSVNLNESIEIPENGIIKESIIKKIQSENAIGVFTGESGGLRYEWTIFGSDITEPKEINLAVSITSTVNGELKVNLSQGEAFGFSCLLSIRLDEKWAEDSATAYQGDKAVASVSLTGSKDNTILNCILDGSLGEFVIKPDALPQEDEISAETGTPTEETTQPTEGNDDYLSKPEGGDDTVYTDGKDKYLTDPIPEGKPKPVEPGDQEVDKGKTYTCTFSIECSTILNNLDMLDPEKLEMVPSGGVILAKTTVTFYEGESVFDVLQRLCQEKGIHMESSWTPIYNSAYIEGIHNLYEFDCGELSGWMYRVNGWYPNYGCSRYQLKDGDVVEWRYRFEKGTMSITDSEGNTTEETVYRLNGEVVDLDDVLTDLGSIGSEGYASGVTPERSEEIRFVLYRENAVYPKVELVFYQYNSTGCLTMLNGEATVFATREDIVTLIEDVNDLVLG